MSDPIEMAIAKIQALEVMAVSEIDRVYNEALHNAIAVVKGMPSALPEHSKGLYVDGYNNGYRDGWKEGREALRREIWEDGRDRLD